VGGGWLRGGGGGDARWAAGQDGHWKAALPGGILYDLAPHPAYLLRGFAGPISDLKVLTRTDDRSHLRELRALVDGAHALGGLTISLETRPFTNRVTLFGTALIAEVNLNNMTLIVRRTRQAPKLLGRVPPTFDGAAQLLRAPLVNGVAYIGGRRRFYPGRGLHSRALYQPLSGGQPPPVSAEEGREAVRLLQAIW